MNDLNYSCLNRSSRGNRAACKVEDMHRGLHLATHCLHRHAFTKKHAFVRAIGFLITISSILYRSQGHVRELLNILKCTAYNRELTSLKSNDERWLFSWLREPERRISAHNGSFGSLFTILNTTEYKHHVLEGC